MLKLVIDLSIWVWEDKRKRANRITLLGFILMACALGWITWSKAATMASQWDQVQGVVISMARTGEDLKEFKQDQKLINNRLDWKINALLLSRGIDPQEVARRADRAFRRVSESGGGAGAQGWAGGGEAPREGQGSGKAGQSGRGPGGTGGGSAGGLGDLIPGANAAPPPGSSPGQD